MKQNKRFHRKMY